MLPPSCLAKLVACLVDRDSSFLPGVSSYHLIPLYCVWKKKVALVKSLSFVSFESKVSDLVYRCSFLLSHDWLYGMASKLYPDFACFISLSWEVLCSSLSSGPVSLYSTILIPLVHSRCPDKPRLFGVTLRQKRYLNLGCDIDCSKFFMFFSVTVSEFWDNTVE